MSSFTKAQCSRLVEIVRDCQHLLFASTNKYVESNRMNNEGWREVTVRFNAENATSKKTGTQIGQKWKNVKKDAKKKHNPRRG